MTPQKKFTVTLREAAEAIGIGHSTAYNAVRNNEFPVRVIKIGGRYVVPVAPLLELLGLDALPNTDDEPNAA